ncbi:MAG: hypothetical protein ACKV19_17270 [Verrucomicrobiales bacterium]
MIPLSFYTILGLLESTEVIASESLAPDSSGKCADPSRESIKRLSLLRSELIKAELELSRAFNQDGTKNKPSSTAMANFRASVSQLSGDLVDSIHELESTNRWLNERLLAILRLLVAVLEPSVPSEGGGNGESPPTWPSGYSSSSSSKSRR